MPGTTVLVSCGSDGRVITTDFRNGIHDEASDFQRPQSRTLFDGYVDISDFDFVGSYLVAAADDSSLVFIPS